MTADDFLAWPGDGRVGKAQLIHGEVHIMSPASVGHGTIQFNLGGVLHAGTSNGLQIVVEAAVRPQLGAASNVRVPDLLGTFELISRGMQTADHPVLIIEILSPGNRDTTRENMMAYATMPSVQELTVIHSTRVLAEVLVRAPDGSWPADPVNFGSGEQLTIITAGIVCPLEAVYAGTWRAA